MVNLDLFGLWRYSNYYIQKFIKNFLLIDCLENGDVTYQTVLNKNTKGFQLGEQSFVLKMDPNPLVLNFSSKEGINI